MTNKQKVKGIAFERLAVDLLSGKIRNSKWKRIPGSGAIGTILGEPALMSDIYGEVDGFSQKFSVEAKVGYGGKAQFTLKKAWLDKIVQEAQNNFRIPFLVGKFSGATSGVKHFVVMDIDTFANIINIVSKDIATEPYDVDNVVG